METLISVQSSDRSAAGSNPASPWRCSMALTEWSNAFTSTHWPGGAESEAEDPSLQVLAVAYHDRINVEPLPEEMVRLSLSIKPIGSIVAIDVVNLGRFEFAGSSPWGAADTAAPDPRDECRTRRRLPPWRRSSDCSVGAEVEDAGRLLLELDEVGRAVVEDDDFHRQPELCRQRCRRCASRLPR